MLQIFFDETIGAKLNLFETNFIVCQLGAILDIIGLPKPSICSVKRTWTQVHFTCMPFFIN
jgi:hypothetical protein